MLFIPGRVKQGVSIGVFVHERYNLAMCTPEGLYELCLLASLAIYIKVLCLSAMVCLSVCMYECMFFFFLKRIQLPPIAGTLGG